ncbi:MAG: DUF3179 domain-containing protein [SAR202 cluster bacterium]|nr:hypothetical protein [Chloroflexota bacterium]MQG57556.1 DUF3179 domain-containing protein [SAR202 cluster bacterium]MQG69355.1 DUF3179 domain-containing protein [SAR202 cluster bacterium]HAL46594.1 hypothetical protein [Dehalococcoidia bacterium]
MRAMTWWDHQTESIWSQPWGAAMAGTLKGTALTLIPASIAPWETWLAEHPDSTVLTNFLNRINGIVHGTRDDFVIGVALEDSAVAYDFKAAAEARVINDAVGLHPVVVFVDPETRDIQVYLRRVSDPESEQQIELTFELDPSGRLVDAETDSAWNGSRGVATEGALQGEALQQIPWVSAFDWAWQDFFPHTTFYRDG